MKLGIITSRATSLMNVARDIAYVAKKQGYVPVLLDYMANPYDLIRMVSQAIVVMTVDPLVARSWLLLSRDMNSVGITSYVYATVEGRLPHHFVKDWMRREVVFVANSRYTESKLTDAGMQVLDVVPHGVNLDEARHALALAPQLRRQIRDQLGDGVVFGVVSTTHPRKGMRRLAETLAKASDKLDKAKFYIVSNTEAKMIFRGIKNVYVDTNYGKRTRTEALALIAAFDFLLHPALAEGFGLPVLEAMAVGVPSIHAAYQPLTEFSPPDANIMVDVDAIIYDTFGEGIEYELHVWNPKSMVEAIQEAIDIKLNRSGEYEERAARLRAAAAKYDVQRLYPRLLDLLTSVEKLNA